MVILIDNISSIYSQLYENAVFSIIFPLIMFTIGISIYGWFIFKFYIFLAKRNLFETNLKKYNYASHPGIKKFFAILFYILEYMILFPLFTFFWFIVLSVIITVISKSMEVPEILLVAVSLIAAIRITSYYKEDLSKDLAKILPFTLLGIFIVDIKYFSIVDSFTKIFEFPSYLNIILYYLIFIVLLEFILRIIYSISGEEDEI